MTIIFEELFQIHILMRGLDYYESGRVINLEKENLAYHGIVSGTIDYDVNISLNNYDTINYMTCTCPYAEGGNNCKHMAAVLFAVNNEEDSVIALDDEGDDIENIVNQIEVSELKHFIIKELIENDKLAQNFKNYFSQYYDGISLQDYIHEVDSIFYEFLGRDRFINYYEAADFGFEISRYLTSIENLIHSEDSFIVLNVIKYLINRLDTVDMDVSSGTTTDIIDKAFDLLEALIRETDVDNPLYSKIFDYTLKLYDDPNIYVYDGRWDSLFIDFFLEEKYLLNKLEFFNQKIEALDSRSKIYRSEPYLMKFYLMKHLERPVEEVIEFLKENSINKAVELKLAEFYLELQQFQEGLDILNVLKSNNDRDISERAIEHLTEYYKKNNKKEQLIELLKSVIVKRNSNNYEYYHLLKKQYKKDEWDKIKNKIIEDIEVDEVKHLKILAEEKMFEKIITHFEESMNVSILRVYEKTLKNKYPTRILKIYQNKCEEMVQYTNGRSHYKKIATYLKQMRKYPNGIDLVDQLINQWIIKYSRRSAMKEEFLKVKSKNDMKLENIYK